MIPLVIEGATRAVGKHQPEYITLHIRDIVYSDGTPAMQSQWEFTPSELRAVGEGGSMILTILGSTWPPVSLTVEPLRESGEPSPDPAQAAAADRAVSEVLTRVRDHQGEHPRPAPDSRPVTLAQAAQALIRDTLGGGTAADAERLKTAYHKAAAKAGLGSNSGTDEGKRLYKFFTEFLKGIDVS